MAISGITREVRSWELCQEGLQWRAVKLGAARAVQTEDMATQA